MRYPSAWLRTIALAASALLLVLLSTGVAAPADNSTDYALTQDALDKMVGVLNDLHAKNLPLNIGDGDLDTEISNLQKNPKVKRILKKHGLSPREFILTYKATAQIHRAAKASDKWQRILQDPNTAPEAKLDATQKLAESLKNNLFTPEQTELVRRRMTELETLLPKAP